MTLIKREDAIDAICKEWCYVTYGNCPHVDDGFVCDGCDDVKALNALPSADTSSDLISRADAIEAVGEWMQKEYGYLDLNRAERLIDALSELPSAEAVQGWRIGKPTEQGKYMVTIDSFGHKRIELFYYGKPLMPNRKVRGKCWYRSDDEWGDVVYDDTDILAWQPLPKPYECGARMKGGDDK